MYEDKLNKHTKIGARETINLRRLKFRITRLSVANNFIDAFDEWRETWRYFVEEEGYYCTCGRPNIHEICVIQNRQTGHELMVGNCCVEHFFDAESGRFFNALRKIDKDITRSANQALINFAFKHNVFDHEEHSFYSAIWRKHRGSLAPEQAAWKKRLNEKLLAAFKVEKLPEGCGF